MDSASGEKSLPGMGGLPRWMKRTTERYDYGDICASPPSNDDGFIHMNRHHRTRPASADGVVGQANPNPPVECYQNQKRWASGTKTSADLTSAIVEIERPGEGSQQFRLTNTILSKKDCATIPEASNFFKTVATTTASFVDRAASSQGLKSSGTQSKQSFKTNSDNTDTVSVIDGNRSAVSSSFPYQQRLKNSNELDSALSPADFPDVVITKPTRDIGNTNYTQQLVEKMKDALIRSPDATPTATPTVTPACSPQVARRTGNPFFTGSAQQGASNNSGSWLFRSSTSTVATTDASGDKERSGYGYEAKIEPGRPLSASAAPGVVPNGMNATRQKVRYVPRPSEMRELNFWSPTSM